MTEQLEFRMGDQPRLLQQFNEFLATELGQDVANEFCTWASKAQGCGKRIGAKAIWEHLRWEYEWSGDAEGQYKLNNNFTPYMARLAEKRYPWSLAGFFEKRKCAA